MYNFGDAISGLFYAFFIAVGAAVILSIYVFWQSFFGLDAWDICSKMGTDAAKVQCMQAHYE